MSQPSPSEISAFLADLAAHRGAGDGGYAQLMNRKADLLERIANARPEDAEAAEVAAKARARADQPTSTD
jgi:hypothetical protein